MAMNNQEAFNRVCEHLAAQGQRCSDPETHSCLYRNEYGLKCAVGALLPDDIYDPSMDIGEKGNSLSVEQLVYHYPKVAELFKNVDIELMSSLQLIHDGYDTIKWETELRCLSKDCGLSFPDIDWSNCESSGP